jgi:hypothetical protein
MMWREADDKGDYLDQVYGPWLNAHHRRGDETLARHKTSFA